MSRHIGNLILNPRLRKNQRMSLIAAFKCSDGVVVCADSQETLALPLPSDDYAEYRVNVDKIEPQQIGHYDVVAGGACHGSLVEGFTEALGDQIETWTESLDSSELKARLRTVILDYHHYEVAVCPFRDKDIHFVICIKDRYSLNAEVHTFVTRTTSITRVKTYALVGWKKRSIGTMLSGTIKRTNKARSQCL